MIKSLLVGLDNSGSSLSALRFACKLARTTGANINALFIEDQMRLLQWEPSSMIGVAMGASTSLPQPLPTEMQVEIEKEFIKEKQNAEKLFNDTCIKENISSTKSRFYSLRGIVDEILFEESKKVSIVFVGKRSDETFFTENAGPTCESLIRKTTRPVIVVPADFIPGSGIVLAYDGGEASQRAIFYAAEMANLLNCKIAVVTVSSDRSKVEKCHGEAREFLKPYNIEAIFIDSLEESKPWNGIIKQAVDFEAGLIVMGAFGANRISELIFGSTTKNVLMRSEHPVLLCR